MAKFITDNFWFNSYVSNRTQSVRLLNVTSKVENTAYGFPHCSVLSPILFNICVIDISRNIRDCLVVQCADDTQFLHEDTAANLGRLTERTKETLNKTKCFLRNGLMINSSKTQCSFIGNKQLLSHIPPDTNKF